MKVSNSIRATEHISYNCIDKPRHKGRPRFGLIARLFALTLLIGLVTTGIVRADEQNGNVKAPVHFACDEAY